MFNWTLCADRMPDLPEDNSFKEFIVTTEYSGSGNINGRKTMCMTLERKGRNKELTWCWNGRTSIWKVIAWAELPDPLN